MVMLKKGKSLTWPFLGLALATTLLYLAGLAALQHGCDDLPTLRAQGSGLFERSAFGASDFQCHRIFRFYWFIFAFVMATFLGLIVCVATKLALHWSRAFWVGMVTISALLMMIASEFFLGGDNAFDSQGWLNNNSRWGMHNRWRVALAGAISSVVSLILLLLAIGTDWDRFGYGHHPSHSQRDDKHAPRYRATAEHIVMPTEAVHTTNQPLGYDRV